MSIKIEVKTTEVTAKEGTSTRSGKFYSFKEQEAWAFIPGQPYPIRCKFTLPDERQGTPYDVGSYTIDLTKSLEVAKFEQLQLSSRLHLVPAPAASSTSRAA